MPQDCVASGSDTSFLTCVKAMSGKRIEDERRREGLSQARLAQRVGLGVSWIREIESGNPKTRIDDHLRCSEALALPPSHIFIPLLFMAHGRAFTPQLLAGNLHELEREWVAFIIDHNIAGLRRVLAGNQPGKTANNHTQAKT